MSLKELKKQIKAEANYDKCTGAGVIDLPVVLKLIDKFEAEIRKRLEFREMTGKKFKEWLPVELRWVLGEDE
jgi:hypothetical protein